MKLLGALLIFLPFQERLAHCWAPLRWVDEIVLVLALHAAAWARLRVREWRFAGERAICIAAGAFVVVGAVSALRNGVPPLIALVGTADYLKGVAFLLAAASLAPARAALERHYRRLLVIALLAAACATGQEAWRLATGASGMERLGLHRVPSFLGHPNFAALFALLFLLIEAARSQRRRVFLLYLPIVFGVSRMAHGAVALLLLPLARRRLWLLPLVGISVGFLVPLASHTRDEFAATESGRVSFRRYAAERAGDVWREDRVWGAGPGRFGGAVALATDSPVYERHPWTRAQMDLHRRYGSLDQFPAQLLAEVGLAGAIAFALLYATLVAALGRAARGHAFGTGLLLAVLAVPLYCLGAGLNLAFYLLTVAVLAGAHLAAPRAP